MNQYLDFYRQNRAAIEAASHPLLNVHRAAAAEAFERLGLPTLKDEAYRYTDVRAAFAPNYGIQIANKQSGIAPFGREMKNCADGAELPLRDEIQNTQSNKDSNLYSATAGRNSAPQGAILHSAAESRNFPPSDPLTALNAMLATDLVEVRIPAGERRTNPISVSHFLSAKMPLMQNRRLRVVAEAGSHVRILLTDKAEENQDFLVTQVTEVFVGEGATVEFYDIEQLHGRCHRFHQLYADVASGGRFTHAAFSLTGGLIRNTTHVRLSGKGAEAELLGCAVIDGHQHCDNNTLIEHAVAGCRSTELYKYVADGHATGAFAGRVLVQPGADQTDSRETSANLVCSTDARIYTQPMLEIYADDVKCSHGSTVGQLNDAALFYMRQRGISESDARLLLKQAFSSEVIARIPYEPLRTRLQILVDQRFRGELNHCRTCNLCGK